MPPRKQKQQPESKTGLVVALVFFILTTLGLGYGTYIGFQGQEGKDAAVKDAQNKLRGMETERDWYRFQAMMFRAYMGHLQADKLEEMRVMRDQFAKDQLGQGQKDKEEVTLLIKNVLDKKIPWDDATNNLRGSYEALLVQEQKKIEALDAQVKTLDTTLAAANKEKRDAEELARTQKVAYEQQLGQANKKVADDTSAFLDKRKDLMEEVQKLGAEKVAVLQTGEDEKKRLRDDLRKKDSQIVAMQNLLNQRNLEVAQLKQRTTEAPKSWKTDWKIVAIHGQTPYINLGSADRVKPQLTFSIHSVDAQGRPNSESKGSLEVVNVLRDHLSQARIVTVKDAAANPILPGDVLFNPSWDPNRVHHVALAGVIDLDGDGRNDILELKRNLERQNVVVDAWMDPKDFTIQGQVGIETEFLILGQGPEGILNARDRLELTRPLENMLTDMRKQAKDNGVEVISLWKYLEKIGYPIPRSLADRPTLGY